MNEPQARKRLESVLRPDEAADDLVLLLRGGVHREDTERLKAQAAELNRRFSFRGPDCYGISVFAATSESEAWVLAKHMDVRRGTTESDTPMSSSWRSCRPSPRPTGR